MFGTALYILGVIGCMALILAGIGLLVWFVNRTWRVLLGLAFIIGIIATEVAFLPH